MPILISSPRGGVTTKTSLLAAATALGVVGRTIVITTAITCDDVTIPETIALQITNGGSISVNNGKTLTINGPFTCNTATPFTGSGKITFGGFDGQQAVLDFSHNQLGIWSVIGPAFPANGFTFGNDFVMRCQGSSDMYLEHLTTASTTTAALNIGVNNNVLISAVTSSNVIRGNLTTGGAELFSSGAQLVIGRETANEEQVNTGDWEYVDATHINITCTKTHNGTTDIEQGGSTLLAASDLFISANACKPAQMTGANPPLRVKDLYGDIIALIPSDMQSAQPYSNWQWGCIQSGTQGVNKDLLYQHNNVDSQVKWRAAAGNVIASLNDDGAFATAAGVQTGAAGLTVDGTNGEIVIGRNTAGAALASTTDAFIIWQSNTDPLNPGSTAGSMLLASRNTVGATLNFATQDTWRGSIGAAGLKILDGFGCNGKSPQAEYTVRANATDLATALTLINEMRAALIANGVCV